jgi:hypothetical protein
MSGPEQAVADLLRRARAARIDGDEGAARAAFVGAFDLAREQRDSEAMGMAALGLAAGYVSGSHLGRVPAFLFEAHNLATGVTRTRLSVALVRAWVYSGNAERAVPFAAEAISGAESSGDPALLANALDAQLLVHWGPDHLDERLQITTRLEDTVAHLADPEARMSAHLWRMTTAMEMLDMPTLRRQLRALHSLADETGSARVRFFSEARNGMHALVVGDIDAARRHRAAAIEAGTAAGESDVVAIEHALGSFIAVQSGDRAAIAAEAELYETAARELALNTVAAEGVPLWVAAGELDRARSQLHQLAGSGPGSIPRDSDWLLVVACLTDSAAASGELGIAAEGYTLLEPYAGRGVANGGAANFNGVVDGYLGAAAAALGRDDDARRWAQSAAELAERFGAVWWTRRYRGGASPPVAESLRRAVLRRASDGVWTIGREGAMHAVREIKGFAYLQLLVRRPGVEVSALDLSDWAARHPGSGVDEASVGELIDRQALAAYRKRLAEIDGELDEFSQPGGAAGASTSGTRCLLRYARRPASAVAPDNRVERPSVPASQSARPSPQRSTGSPMSTVNSDACCVIAYTRAPVASTILDPTRSITWLTD